MNKWSHYNNARSRIAAGTSFVVRKDRPVRRYLMAGVGLAAILAAALAAPAAAVAGHYEPTPLYVGAAGAWTFYNEAKKYLLQGDIDLNSSTFRMSLYTSASTGAGAATVSVISQVDDEVSEGNGYSSSGKALTGVSWTVGASASEYRFNANAVVWTATGGNIANVKFAVIWIEGASAGARKVLCRSTLSTSQFTIGTGNTLTITPSANGIFELN